LRQIRDIEDIGASVSCTASRDDILYSGQVHQDDLRELVEILGDAVQNPIVLDRVIETLQESLQTDIAAVESDSVAHAVELLHAAAFREKGLGLPLIVPSYNLSHLTAENVLGTSK